MSDEEELTAPPPPSIKGSFPPEKDRNEDGWTCGDCANVNYNWRNACNRCSKAKPTVGQKKMLGHQIGKQQAEKSRGLFSADDWQCSKCSNVNWARRSQCNVCNAPKYGEIEERTGFGGGYNDRGVVEYKERQDSDDEYDEFGRRKRKKGEFNSKPEVPKPEVPEPEVEEKKQKTPERAEEEEEDDEEDEDDDGDLSKYDLSDWGEVPENNSNFKSRSRSRSRSPITK